MKAGVRLDAERRYTSGRPGRRPARSDAVRRFLRFYGPATLGDFADWAGLAKPHAQRRWRALPDDHIEVREGRNGWRLLAADLAEFGSPPPAAGIRLLPPGDAYLQKPNRPLLAPDDELRKRLFRPVASPGAVVRDGRLVGLWRAKAKGRKLELTVERLGKLARGGLDEEADRLAALRGASEPVVVFA